MTTYTLSNAWERERERLAAMQRTYDPGTVAAFEACGVAPGWRCLEVGGGVGSVATWLAGRVGATGEVVATDVDTRWLETLPGITARVHNLVSDPLEESTYDLVHARLLVEHLPDRPALVAKLAAALKPGGWLVVEDLVWTTAVSDEPWPEYDAILAAVHAAMAAGGYDRDFGYRLPRLMESAGLVDMQSALGGQGDRTIGRTAWRLLVEPFRETLVSAGLVGDDVIERFLARLDGDDWVLFPPVMVSARARRP